jgi:hypothetical protein
MAGLIRITDRYSTDRRSADKSIRVQMQFILDNIDHLGVVDRRGTKVKLAQQIADKMIRNEELLEWERSAIDGLYEDTWKGYGMPSVQKHIDKKRKGLKFG